MEITPMITMRMAMTIATIGRRIKKFAMLFRLFRGLERLGVDRSAFFYLLKSFNNHPLRRLDTFLNDPHVSHSLPHLHRADAGLVFRGHHCNLISALGFDYGALWHQQCVLSHRGRKPDAGKLSWPQHAIRIVKGGCEANGSCFQVNLAIGDNNRSLMWIDASIRENQF